MVNPEFQTALETALYSLEGVNRSYASGHDLLRGCLLRYLGSSSRPEESTTQTPITEIQRQTLDLSRRQESELHVRSGLEIISTHPELGPFAPTLLSMIEPELAADVVGREWTELIELHLGSDPQLTQYPQDLDGFNGVELDANTIETEEKSLAKVKDVLLSPLLDGLESGWFEPAQAPAVLWYRVNDSRERLHQHVPGNICYNLNGILMLFVCIFCSQCPSYSSSVEVILQRAGGEVESFINAQHIGVTSNRYGLQTQPVLPTSFSSVHVIDPCDSNITGSERTLYVLLNTTCSSEPSDFFQNFKEFCWYFSFVSGKPRCDDIFVLFANFTILPTDVKSLPHAQWLLLPGLHQIVSLPFEEASVRQMTELESLVYPLVFLVLYFGVFVLSEWRLRERMFEHGLSPLSLVATRRKLEPRLPALLILLDCLFQASFFLQILIFNFFSALYPRHENLGSIVILLTHPFGGGVLMVGRLVAALASICILLAFALTKCRCRVVVGLVEWAQRSTPFIVYPTSHFGGFLPVLSPHLYRCLLFCTLVVTAIFSYLLGLNARSVDAPILLSLVLFNYALWFAAGIAQAKLRKENKHSELLIQFFAIGNLAHCFVQLVFVVSVVGCLFAGSITLGLVDHFYVI